MSINYTSFTNSINVFELEKEINDRFSNNIDFDINKITIFAKISNYSYYPIESTIDDEGKIRIKKSNDYINLDLYIGSKQQFLHKQIILNQNSYKIELDEYFKTAWNPDKFIIFQNGYLMNHGLFSYIIPSFDNSYLKKYIYSTALFRKNTRIDIFYIESEDNFFSVPISRDTYLGTIKYIARKNNERVIPIPYPFKEKKSYFMVFNEQGYYLENENDYVLSNDKFFISLKTPLELATINYITFTFPLISKEKEEIDLTNISIIPEDDEPDFTGYYFDIYESIYSPDGYIRYNPSFPYYDLVKEDFLLFGNSTFIHPLRYQFINNTSLRMIGDIDKRHSPWAHYNMIIPVSKDAKTKYKEDYIQPKFKIVELVTTERTNTLEFPVIEEEYESVMIFRNSLILSIYDEDRFIIDDINHKFIIVNEEDWIPANTTVTFIFMSSKTNTDQKLILIQESFKCSDYTTPLPETIYRYAGQRFNKTKLLLFLNGTFITPERFRLSHNTIYLLDGDIDFNDDHTYTIIYLDEVNSEEYGVEQNLINKTYEDELDNIVIETAISKPIQG